jgi:hypothetical protein
MVIGDLKVLQLVITKGVGLIGYHPYQGLPHLKMTMRRGMDKIWTIHVLFPRAVHVLSIVQFVYPTLIVHVAQLR